MSAAISDTTPEMEKVLISLLRQVPPVKKLEMLNGLNRSARELAMNGIRRRHPEATERQVRWYLCSLLYGDDITCKVLGKQEDA